MLEAYLSLQAHAGRVINQFVCSAITICMRCCDCMLEVKPPLRSLSALYVNIRQAHSVVFVLEKHASCDSPAIVL